jgi:squalene-hopene/tetraprenyl-beta-curcumene cyclase
MMFDALGYSHQHPEFVTARKAIDKLLVVRGDEAYCQPCMSPVWDTALVCHTLLEVGTPAASGQARRALGWLRERQVLDVRGDWSVRRPNVRPGGWAFQYENPHYPDLDDTAAVVLAMDRLARLPASEGREVDFAEAIERGKEWILGLQSRSGGWGAFDADNTSEYLNHLPFADHGALLDPPTPDVTARCVGVLAQLGRSEDSDALQFALRYLRSEQRADGSWFGRWGINYIYGTWSVLCAFHCAGVSPAATEVRRAVAWLLSIQNGDGGWGEHEQSYALDGNGFRQAASTPSQTAWATLALLAAGEVGNDAVRRGIAYLVGSQQDDGFWQEPEFTATGFPRVFYLRYHGYPKFFPLWALARYRRLLASAPADDRFGL